MILTNVSLDFHSKSPAFQVKDLIDVQQHQPDEVETLQLKSPRVFLNLCILSLSVKFHLVLNLAIIGFRMLSTIKIDCVSNTLATCQGVG